MGPIELMANGAFDDITPDAVGRLVLGGVSMLIDADAARNADAVLTLCRAFAALSGRPEMTDAELGAILGPFLSAALTEENARLRALVCHAPVIAHNPDRAQIALLGALTTEQVKRDPDPTVPGAPGERVERRG